MDVIRVSLGIRALRRRRNWSQRQLATKATVSRSVIWRIERGQADKVAVHTLIGVAAALGARIDVRVLWQGEGLDRLLDARHASLVELVVGLLTSSDWNVAPEVSFNIRGERGSIDILAFHRRSGSLLVIEVKSVVPDIQAMLVGIDRKGRPARDIARERGWVVTLVTRMLVLPDDRTARRRVQIHSATIDTILPARTIEIRRWLRDPVGPMPGVLFVSDAHHPGNRHRIRSTTEASARP
jgi:transcriptional regulator with XRE-family HTH domain